MSLAKRCNALKTKKFQVFTPSRLAGELSQEWIRSKNEVNIDSNLFIDCNANSDDPMLLVRQSRLFNVRQDALAEARKAQVELLDTLAKEKKIEAVPEKWRSAIDTLKKGSKQKAEAEYGQLSKWKVRTEERKPEADVFAHDYLWVMHALKQKTCMLESQAIHFFPLPFVVDGIRKLATKILGMSNPPESAQFYTGLCPWLQLPSKGAIEGYPVCVTPTQAWQLFRHAGYELACQVRADNPDLLLSSPKICGYIFERFASSPAFMAQYTNHWSRCQLSTGGDRFTLSRKQLGLLSLRYRAFPAFKIQQAWWYSQPDRLREETLDEGIYFYQVPSVRHTLLAGTPALRDITSELAANLLWSHFSDEEELDLTNDDLYKEFAGAIAEINDEASNREAWERVTEEMFGEDSPLVKTPDLTRMPPAAPNTFYDETYRPILRYEIDHATSEGIELPDWYTRRRRELARGPHASLVPDLAVNAAGETLDFSGDIDEDEGAVEDEPLAGAVQKDAAGPEEEPEEVTKDAWEDESLPIQERLRLARLQMGIQLKREDIVQNVMQGRDASSHYDRTDTDAAMALAQKKHDQIRAKQKQHAEHDEDHRH